MTSAQLSRRRAWFLALRPFSYTTAIIPVLVGTGLAAETEFDPLRFFLALAGSVLIELHDEWQVAERRYLSEASMALLDPALDDGSKEEVDQPKTLLLAS